MLKATCRTREQRGWRTGHILYMSKPTAIHIILNGAAQIVPSGPQKGMKNPSPPKLNQSWLSPPPPRSALPNPAYQLPASLSICEVFGVLYIWGLSRFCPGPYPSARGRGGFVFGKSCFALLNTVSFSSQYWYGRRDNRQVGGTVTTVSSHQYWDWMGNLQRGDPFCCTIWAANRATPAAVTSYSINPNCRD